MRSQRVERPTTDRGINGRADPPTQATAVQQRRRWQRRNRQPERVHGGGAIRLAAVGGDASSRSQRNDEPGRQRGRDPAHAGRGPPRWTGAVRHWLCMGRALHDALGRWTPVVDQALAERLAVRLAECEARGAKTGADLRKRLEPLLERLRGGTASAAACTALSAFTQGRPLPCSDWGRLCAAEPTNRSPASLCVCVWGGCTALAEGNLSQAEEAHRTLVLQCSSEVSRGAGANEASWRGEKEEGRGWAR